MKLNAKRVERNFPFTTPFNKVIKIKNKKKLRENLIKMK